MKDLYEEWEMHADRLVEEARQGEQGERQTLAVIPGSRAMLMVWQFLHALASLVRRVIKRYGHDHHHGHTSGVFPWNEMVERMDKLEAEMKERPTTDEIVAGYSKPVGRRLDEMDEKVEELEKAQHERDSPRRDHRLSHHEMLQAWNIVDECFKRLEKLRRPP